MLISRKSILSGIIRTYDLPVTQDEVNRFEKKEFAQKIWPHLSSDIREFIINGITPREWANLYEVELELNEEKRRWWGTPYHTMYNDVLPAYAIYDHPKDYPDSFVVNRWLCGSGISVRDEDYIILSDSVELIKTDLENKGLSFMPRSADDDPCIIGTYI